MSQIEGVNGGHAGTAGCHRSIYLHIYTVAAAKPNISYSG